MLCSCTARFSLVRVSDKKIFLAIFVQLGDQHPLRNIGERCKDSPTIQAFFDDGKYLMKMYFVPIVLTVATEELGKVCSRVQPIKSSFIVPPGTTPKLV
jgi:hypothetical protein